ncbi:MAG: glycosyltransferase, partial [Bacteroidota bacterium]
GELHRFIPVLVSLETVRIKQIAVNHHARQFGESKYGLGRTFKVISDLLLMLFFKRYLLRPMHLFGNTGIIMFLVGVLINLYLLGLKMMGQDIWGKPLMILGLLLLLGGIQFITIGIVVEIQMRTYFESQGKRPYKIREVIRE